MISIIVPVYNVEKYINDCIQSVLQQTYTNWELLLIDDGSTDNSGMICDGYAKTDRRIHVFHTINGGVCKARNIGLDNMTGNFCMFLDSDDMIHPLLLEYSMKISNEHNAELVIYGYKKVKDAYVLDHVASNNISENIECLSVDDALQEILAGKRFRMLVCNKLYNSRLWNDLRFPTDRKYGDDSAVTYRIVYRSENIVYTDAELYFYRDRPGSALNSNISCDNLQLFDSYSEIFKFIYMNKTKFSRLAAYAYDIRIFDFFWKVKNCHVEEAEKLRMISMLREKSIDFMKALITAERITIKQRFLLMIFFVDSRFFWKIYNR